MVSEKRIVVDAVELRNTFDFVSAGAPLEHSAYICADTGKIYWTSDTEVDPICWTGTGAT